MLAVAMANSRCALGLDGRPLSARELPNPCCYTGCLLDCGTHMPQHTCLENLLPTWLPTQNTGPFRSQSYLLPKAPCPTPTPSTRCCLPWRHAASCAEQVHKNCTVAGMPRQRQQRPVQPGVRCGMYVCPTFAQLRCPRLENSLRSCRALAAAVFDPVQPASGRPYRQTRLVAHGAALPLSGSPRDAPLQCTRRQAASLPMAAKLPRGHRCGAARVGCRSRRPFRPICPRQRCAARLCASVAFHRAWPHLAGHIEGGLPAWPVRRRLRRRLRHGAHNHAARAAAGQAPTRPWTSCPEGTAR